MKIDAKDTSYNVVALIYAILKESSVDTAIVKIFNNQEYKLNHEDREDMYRLQMQGLKIKEIAEVFNVSYDTAYRGIRTYENGIKKGLSEVATSSRPKVKLC